MQREDPDSSRSVAGRSGSPGQEHHDLQVRQRALELQNEQLRKTNGELEESRARLSDLYDFAPVVYLSMDAGCRVLSANLTAASMFGRERGRLVGTLLTAFVSPEERTNLRAHVERCLTERIRVDSEISFKVRGRARVFTQVTSTPQLGEDGRATACKTVIIDISAFKWSQEKLSFLTEASALLGSSFDTTAIIAEIARKAVPALADLCVVDLLQPSGELRRVEAAIADPRQAVELANARMTTPRAHDGTAIGGALRSREAILIEHVTTGELNPDPAIEQDGLVKAIGPSSIMYVPIIGRGESLGLLTFASSSSSSRRYSRADLGSMRDLASRIALAVENARLYEQAQRAIASRHDMLQFVSHDLRNPLMGIMLSAETMLKAAPEVERRRSGSQIARVARAGKQMRRMIEDLLDSTALDAGHLSIEIGAHGARELVEAAMDLLLPQAAARNVELTADVASDAPVACDRHRVLQVLSNLVDNAVKFTPAQGRITISAHPMGEDMLFTVADTGAGIPAEVRPQVFERYKQAARSAGEGRGLGLYIARGLVEAQRGAIWVDSKEGAGTTFSFTLPLASQAAGDGFAQNESAPAPGA